jgi:serine/threonine protein kinase
LILEHIEAIPLRRAVLTDRAVFFDALFEHINALHARGVAHFDLKKKDNLLVTAAGLPCLIDFGAAMIRKPGLAPLNRYLYRLAERFDFNAWVKLKYDGKYTNVSAVDRVYFRRSFVEKAARALKRGYQRLKPARWGKRP